jgi:hypothetical protein
MRPSTPLQRADPMPRPRQQMFWRHLRRRLFAALALVAYFATAVGVPLPALAMSGQGQALPNQKGPCGCPIGEQVSGHCCCCGADGRSPWTTAPAREQAEHNSCAPCAAPPKSCCSSRAKTAPDAQTQSSQPIPSAAKPRVPRVSAATCQCTTTLWVTTGEVCPPPYLLTWFPYELPGGQVSCSATSIRPVTVSPPDPPPRYLGV